MDVRAEAMNSETIEIPKGTKNIPDGAYSHRTDIHTVIFPEGLETIGKEAFEGCINLTVPVFPKSLKKIGDKAFYGCTSIDRFDVDENNPYLESRKGVIYSKENELIAYPPGCLEDTYEPEDDTVAIADFAFGGNRHLESISIGRKVSKVTGRAFLGCSKLARINVDPDNDFFTSYNGILYSGSRDTLVYLPPRPKRYVIYLYGILRLGPCCFADCDSLFELTLHNCIESISMDAFGKGCRPKKLIVEKDIECPIPFTLTDWKGKKMREGKEGGYLYRHEEGDIYSALGKWREPSIHSDDLDDIRRIAYNDDDEVNVFRPIKVTDTSFDDIAGLEDAKELIYRHLILPSKHPDLFKRFDLDAGTGVLLYGPPGTGKTMLARAIASEIDAKFYSIKTTDIRDCFVGNSEKNIRALFEAARKNSRAVIFFDDFDSLGRGRGNSSEPWQSDLIDELLLQMQGIERYSSRLIVLAATNRPWEIDSALMRSGRFSTHIHVGLPNAQAREKILRNRLSRIPHRDDIDFGSFANMTEGYNAADIEEVCKTAKMRRISLIDSGDKDCEVRSEDVDYALTIVHSSVSRKDLDEIEQYRRFGNLIDNDEIYIPKEDRPIGYY